MTRLPSLVVPLLLALAGVSLPALVAAEEAPAGPAGQRQLEPTATPGMRQRALPVGERVTAGTRFNPAISVILEGIYFNELSGHADEPGGLELGHGHGHGHDHGFDEGFNFRETEFVFEATVDPYFDAFAMITFEDVDEVDLEEAYIQTRALPAGLQLKAGRFLSDIGYINRFHPHDWDFVDRPLFSEFLFGDEGLQELGIQGSWLAPTRDYLRLGVELLQGDTEGVASHVGENGDLPFDDAAGPRLFTGFLKWGPDLGFDHAALFGVSGGYARSFQRLAEGEDEVETWDGDAWFAGLDAVYKYDAGGYRGHGDWTLQAEWFYREIDVDFLELEPDGTPMAPSTAGRLKHDGLYAQAVYGIAPRWQVGLRGEALGMVENVGFRDEDEPFADFDTSYRTSGMVTWRPSEFSYLRGQLSYSDFARGPDESREDAWTVMLQYVISIGVHGAHDF